MTLTVAFTRLETRMPVDNRYPRAVHVRAFGRNKIGKTDPGAFEGFGETGVVTSPNTLEVPITTPLPEVDQILNLEDDLVLVTKVQQGAGKVLITYRAMPNATKTLAKIKRGELD
jgi:hypothetical protein